nr:hypothetical protein CFP56_24276 [Quercus suber]
MMAQHRLRECDEWITSPTPPLSRAASRATRLMDRSLPTASHESYLSDLEHVLRKDAETTDSLARPNLNLRTMLRPGEGRVDTATEFAFCCSVVFQTGDHRIRQLNVDVPLLMMSLPCRFLLITAGKWMSMVQGYFKSSPAGNMAGMTGRDMPLLRVHDRTTYAIIVEGLLTIMTGLNGPAGAVQWRGVVNMLLLSFWNQMTDVVEISGGCHSDIPQP